MESCYVAIDDILHLNRRCKMHYFKLLSESSLDLFPPEVSVAYLTGCELRKADVVTSIRKRETLRLRKIEGLPWGHKPPGSMWGLPAAPWLEC